MHKHVSINVAARECCCARLQLGVKQVACIQPRMAYQTNQMPASSLNDLPAHLVLYCLPHVLSFSFLHLGLECDNGVLVPASDNSDTASHSMPQHNINQSINFTSIAMRFIEEIVPAIHRISQYCGTTICPALGTATLC